MYTEVAKSNDGLQNYYLLMQQTIYYYKLLSTNKVLFGYNITIIFPPRNHFFCTIQSIKALYTFFKTTIIFILNYYFGGRKVLLDHIQRMKALFESWKHKFVSACLFLDETSC